MAWFGSAWNAGAWDASAWWNGVSVPPAGGGGGGVPPEFAKSLRAQALANHEAAMLRMIENGNRIADAQRLEMARMEQDDEEAIAAILTALEFLS